MEEEKIEFNADDFDKIWEEELKEADAIDKNKITLADREFARGFYMALDFLDNAILNAVDEIEEETDTLHKIKSEIIEETGEHIKSQMRDNFYDVVTSILESHVE